MYLSTRCGWALAADLLCGEPPASIHPTVWMGGGLGMARRWHRSRARHPAASLAAGASVMVVGVVVSASLGAACERAMRCLPRRLRHSAGGLLLKPTLSLRALVDAGGEVERALRRGRLDDARRALAWHLVSRDTGQLTAAEVAGAAIESLAENLGDSLVGPLLAHAAGGLPAACAYRFINTADAMLGYRTPELEWFGKAAARADDAVNLPPARLAALLIALAAPVARASGFGAMRVVLADAWRTPSPNAGWPMAAMAGALGVRLDKRTVRRTGRRTTELPVHVRGPRRAPCHLYVLNAGGRAPTWRDVARARRLVAVAGLLCVALLSAMPPMVRRTPGRHA